VLSSHDAISNLRKRILGHPVEPALNALRIDLLFSEEAA
jgi:hypothetical protein